MRRGERRRRDEKAVGGREGRQEKAGEGRRRLLVALVTA
jgi:hypothetical protein